MKPALQVKFDVKFDICFSKNLSGEIICQQNALLTESRILEKFGCLQKKIWRIRKFQRLILFFHYFVISNERKRLNHIKSVKKSVNIKRGKIEFSNNRVKKISHYIDLITHIKCHDIGHSSELFWIFLKRSVLGLVKIWYLCFIISSAAENLHKDFLY